MEVHQIHDFTCESKRGVTIVNDAPHYCRSPVVDNNVNRSVASTVGIVSIHYYPLAIVPSGRKALRVGIGQ